MSNYGAGKIVPQGKTGGWSASGDFLSGSEVDEVSLQCNFPVAANYTVEFNLVETAPSPIPIRAEALITWSVEGNSVTRRVNVGNGVSVSGVGAACRVVIKDTTDKTTLPANLGFPYRASVQVAPGTRATTEEPPTLSPFPNLPADATTILAGGVFAFPIPKDAGVVSVSVTASIIGAAPPPIPDQGVLVFQTQLLAILKQYDFRFDVWVPVAPGAEGIAVRNNTASSVIVSCTFGIDG